MLCIWSNKSISDSSLNKSTCLGHGVSMKVFWDEIHIRISELWVKQTALPNGMGLIQSVEDLVEQKADFLRTRWNSVSKWPSDLGSRAGQQILNLPASIIPWANSLKQTLSVNIYAPFWFLCRTLTNTASLSQGTQAIWTHQPESWKVDPLTGDLRWGGIQQEVIPPWKIWHQGRRWASIMGSHCHELGIPQ